MSKKLEFRHKDYVKYGSMRIYIENPTLELKDKNFRIVNEYEKTDFDYKKAVVELEPDLCILMNKIEAQINKHLKNNNEIPRITIIYRNKVYCKTNLDNPSEISKITVSIYGLVRKERFTPKYGFYKLNNYNFWFKKIMIVL